MGCEHIMLIKYADIMSDSKEPRRLANLHYMSPCNFSIISTISTYRVELPYQLVLYISLLGLYNIIGIATLRSPIHVPIRMWVVSLYGAKECGITIMSFCDYM